MLGYVHNTTKIWRIWDFNSGRTRWAVERSSVIFQEGANAHIEEWTKVIEFPDNADELHDEIYEMDKKTESRGINDSLSQQNSKSKDSLSLSVVTSKSAQWAAGRNIIARLSPANRLNELLGRTSSLRCHQQIGSMSCWAEYHLSVVTSKLAQWAAGRNIIFRCHQWIVSMSCWVENHFSIATSELAQWAAGQKPISLQY